MTTTTAITWNSWSKSIKATWTMSQTICATIMFTTIKTTTMRAAAHTKSGRLGNKVHHGRTSKCCYVIRIRRHHQRVDR
jgi:hypothetical protein